jgi:hypothetical protein
MTPRYLPPDAQAETVAAPVEIDWNAPIEVVRDGRAYPQKWRPLTKLMKAFPIL